MEELARQLAYAEWPEAVPTWPDDKLPDDCREWKRPQNLAQGLDVCEGGNYCCDDLKDFQRVLHSLETGIRRRHPDCVGPHITPGRFSLDQYHLNAWRYIQPQDEQAHSREEIIPGVSFDWIAGMRPYRYFKFCLIDEIRHGLTEACTKDITLFISDLIVYVRVSTERLENRLVNNHTYTLVLNDGVHRYAGTDRPILITRKEKELTAEERAAKDKEVAERVERIAKSLSSLS